MRGIDQQRVDRVLADAGLADAAADRHARGIAAHAVENFRRDQFVVEHDVGVLQRAQRLDGQQIRIARTCADQRHPARRFARCQRAGKGNGIGNLFQRRLSFAPASGKDQRADRAIDHPLPEAAAQRHLRNAVVHQFAPAADERGEIADAGGQHSFDALAHAARHDRRSSAGADGNDHVAAIDDGGKNESRMREIVHHIDGQTDRLGPRRHRNSDVAGARAQDGNDAGEIGRQRIAIRKLDPRHIGSGKPAQIMLAVGREVADARASRRQQAQFRPRQIAGADQQHRSGLQVEKDWQESHATLAAPTCGVD